ncbi:MAG: PilZ domain-containing protein [Clostridia bacterium]|nr:PilZ domain-containing protein [Clostridia bacterium]
MLDYTFDKKDFLGNILKKKSKIKFRVNNGSMWYITTIEAVEGDEIILAFPEMFAAMGVILGDMLVCRFSDDEYEYSFEGDVDFIKIDFPQSIRIKLSNEVERFENSRQAKREDTIFLADVFLLGSDEAFHSCVRDVSSTGLKIITKHHIEVDTDIEVQLALPVRNIFDSVVKLRGKVVRSNPRNDHKEYGISVTHIDKVYQDRLKHFFETYG